jgi:hypothetical protein
MCRGSSGHADTGNKAHHRHGWADTGEQQHAADDDCGDPSPALSMRVQLSLDIDFAGLSLIGAYATPTR